MKKVLLIAAVAVFGFTANAQDISFGAKAGLNMANLGGDADGDMKMGFHVGGVVEIAIADQFSVAPELLFSLQGTKYEESGSEFGVSYSAEGKTHLSYINLPIMARYYITEGFSVEAGPQVGFLISATEDYEATVDGEVIDEVSFSGEDISDFTNSLDFGFNIGAGYKLDSGLFFQARYNLGLANVYDSDDFKVTNNVIQVSVGYMFN